MWDSAAQDWTTVDGIPVTSPARTVLDLAADGSRRDLGRLLKANGVQVHWASTGEAANRTVLEIMRRRREFFERIRRDARRR